MDYETIEDARTEYGSLPTNKLLFFCKLHDKAILPIRGTEHSAGWDLSYCDDIDITLNPGDRCPVPTGLAVRLPRGTYGAVCPRSGLAVKHGITVLNAPGIIDFDYRGEIHVVLINHGSLPFIITKGMRIGQLIVIPYDSQKYLEVGTLVDDKTKRGTGGFGSTGA